MLEDRVRHAIHVASAERGIAPEVDALAAGLGATTREVEAALDALAAAHQLVLAPGPTRLSAEQVRLPRGRGPVARPVTHRVWMAHPFSAVPTSFRVRANDRTYFANCAWDALAIPSVLGSDAVIELRCGDCGAPQSFAVAGGVCSPDEGLVHFWENIAFT